MGGDEKVHPRLNGSSGGVAAVPLNAAVAVGLLQDSNHLARCGEDVDHRVPGKPCESQLLQSGIEGIGKDGYVPELVGGDADENAPLYRQIALVSQAGYPYLVPTSRGTQRGLPRQEQAK